MANFEIAYNMTSGNEGGYLSAADAAKQGDKGGETYMGIARNFNSDWSGWKIIDAYKKNFSMPAYNSYIPDSDGTLKALVKQRYKQNYWDIIKGDSIASQDIANLLYDMDVNSGGGGVKIVQGSINKIIAPSRIDVDGGVGKDTLSHINSLPQDALYQQIYNDRKNWIQTTGKSVGSATVVDSWLSRLEKYKKEITDDVQQAAVSAGKAFGYATETVKRNPILLISGVVLVLIGGGLFYKFANSQNNIQ